MTQRPKRGRVYRRCGCKDGTSGKQLGSWCPRLAADTTHGRWTYAVDLAPEDGKRRTRRRGGFASRAEAAREMARVLDAEYRGVYEDRTLRVGLFLYEWLEAKRPALAPNTWAGYRACIERDLVPAFGGMLLVDLRPKHIDAWVSTQLATGRGHTTVHHAVSMLRNALDHAVRTWRLRYNPAKHSVPAKPRAAVRTCWTPDQAAAFLRHNAEHYADRLTDLFEVMLGTGMRRGEVLALHWSDVHLMDRKLYVHWTLTAVNNGKIHLGEPKTEASRAWISLSPRVMAALHRQAALQMAAHPNSRLEGLVFTRPDGEPLRPQWVLDQLRKRTTELDLPRIGLHDLRHTAASIMIAAGIPLTVVSKTLRHSNLAITVDLYGHLLKDSADEAVVALAAALDRADAGLERIPPSLCRACIGRLSFNPVCSAAGCTRRTPGHAGRSWAEEPSRDRSRRRSHSPADPRTARHLRRPERGGDPSGGAGRAQHPGRQGSYPPREAAGDPSARDHRGGAGPDRDRGSRLPELRKDINVRIHTAEKLVKEIRTTLTKVRTDIARLGVKLDWKPKNEWAGFVTDLGRDGF